MRRQKKYAPHERRRAIPTPKKELMEVTKIQDAKFKTIGIWMLKDLRGSMN